MKINKKFKYHNFYIHSVLPQKDIDIRFKHLQSDDFIFNSIKYSIKSTKSKK